MFKSLLNTLFLLSTLALSIGCSQLTCLSKKNNSVSITGTITFERVPVQIESYGMIKLNYNNIQTVTAKNILIKAIDKKGKTVSKTTTDSNGLYQLYVPQNTPVKIRAYARMFQEGKWDVAVKDNTAQKAMYVIEGQLYNSGTSSTNRNLHASSGWGGHGYTGSRDAAPFAILDSIHQAMKKVLDAKPNTIFPQLTVNWSVNNVAAAGDQSLGQIVTSNYDGESNLWILGDENSDTDEYDNHIIIHEWGHFFEDKFSRSDSIGGPHSPGDSLDIRVAFGEGWGNAISAIATDDPIYFDTAGERQASGWFMDIENASPQNPGWFSEASIQRILYDLYDSNNEGMDNLSLGFEPIFNVMVEKEKNTPAFTSIFSFIHALKSENPSDAYRIDQIVASEHIASIHDAYGNYRTNTAKGGYNKPVYRTLGVGQRITQCNKNQYGIYNKLGNRTFLKVTIPSSGYYSFKAMPYTHNGYGDPDMIIYKAQYPLESMGMSPLEGSTSDSLEMNLNKGEYLLEIYDASFSNSCFNVTLTKEENSYNSSELLSKQQRNRRPKRMPQY